MDPAVKVEVRNTVELGARARARSLDWPLVMIGLFGALAFVVAVSLVATIVVDLLGAERGDLSAVVTTISFFFGFLSAGIYVASHAPHDRMLHALALVSFGLVACGILMTLDLVAGVSIESVMPAYDGSQSITHVGLWMVTTIIVTAATLLGAAVVPRGDQDWGMQLSEPEDTEL